MSDMPSRFVLRNRSHSESLALQPCRNLRFPAGPVLRRMQELTTDNRSKTFSFRLSLCSKCTRKLPGKGLEHYDAYLNAAKREDGQYKALADRLKRKPPEQEATKTEKRKKA